MNRLLRIELIKLRSNASFWVLISLHVTIIMLVVLTGKRLIDSIQISGTDIDNLIDPSAIPLYQFPDVWHNITYVAGFLKFILAIYVIISITTEITYDTLRQNIMNGLSRFDFIISKLFMVLLLSLGSAVFIFLMALFFGLTSTPDLHWHDIIKYSGFVPAYFLQLTTYLIFALLTGILIKRTGLAMGLMFLYTLIIEPVLAFRINSLWLKNILPIKAMNNLIHMPFGKYALQEVQDFVAWKDVMIVTGYCILFVYLTYIILKRRDL